jgi:uncharacterized membrane protein
MRTRWTLPTRWTLFAVTLAIAITLATGTYLAVVYPTLPAALPVRYLHGTAAVFQSKSPTMVFLPAIVQGGLLVIFGSLGSLLLWRARPSASDSRSAEDGARMRLAAEGIALLGLVWIGVQAIGAARLIILWRTPDGSGFGVVYNVVMGIGIVLSIVLVRRTMRLVRHEPPTPAAVDPAMWRMTNLYFNRADSALFVPTRSGLGWTLNFGRPVAIVFMGAILVIGILGPYYVARFVLRFGG